MWLLRLGYKRHYSFFLGLSLDHFLKVTSADPSLLSGKELRPPASSFVRSPSWKWIPPAPVKP